MFYEIHPQIWDQGIMSEAFSEVLRFAMEEVGCCKVLVSPGSIFAECALMGGQGRPHEQQSSVDQARTAQWSAIHGDVAEEHVSQIPVVF